MLARDEPALQVAGVAVGVVAGLAVDADRALEAGVVRHEPHDTVVGDVAEQEEVAIAEIDRPLGPGRARPQLHQPHVAADQVAERAFVIRYSPMVSGILASLRRWFSRAVRPAGRCRPGSAHGSAHRCR